MYSSSSRRAAVIFFQAAGRDALVEIGDTSSDLEREIIGKHGLGVFARTQNRIVARDFRHR